MEMEPIKVVITEAAGPTAYSLLHQIAKGDVFGPTQPIILHLLVIPALMGVLEGVSMELMDCALSLLEGIVPTADPTVAFTDVQAAFLIGGPLPRQKDMEWGKLFSANVNTFKDYGQALDKHAKKTVKVLVLGDMANTLAFISAKYAPSIPKENFAAMSRLDQNRAQAQLASRLGVGVKKIRNVLIWGQHYPDARSALVMKGGEEVRLTDLLPDASWLQDQFITAVQGREDAVLSARKVPAAMSAANAAGYQMRDWWQGTATTGTTTFVSMGVISDGSYRTPTDIFFSFPVTIMDKQWAVVKGLTMDSFSKDKVQQAGQELVEEREEALALCGD